MRFAFEKVGKKHTKKVGKIPNKCFCKRKTRLQTPKTHFKRARNTAQGLPNTPRSQNAAHRERRQQVHSRNLISRAVPWSAPHSSMATAHRPTGVAYAQYKRNEVLEAVGGGPILPALGGRGRWRPRKRVEGGGLPGRARTGTSSETDDSSYFLFFRVLRFAFCAFC